MKVLLSREELSDGVDRLAALVQNDRGDQPVVLVGVLLAVLCSLRISYEGLMAR